MRDSRIFTATPWHRPGCFTDALYEKSAQSTATVCTRDGIPRDRARRVRLVNAA